MQIETDATYHKRVNFCVTTRSKDSTTEVLSMRSYVKVIMYPEVTGDNLVLYVGVKSGVLDEANVARVRFGFETR